MVATVFLAIGQMWSATFQGAGQPIILAKAEALSLLTTIVSLIVLLPRMGILGAALASLFAYGFSTLYLNIKLIRVWDFRWLDLLGFISIKEIKQ